jgi:anti-sigma B factor antagonist
VKIKEEEKGGFAVIGLSGKIMGGSDSTMFHGKVHECLDAGKMKIIVDLTKVEWMNSSGLGMLTAALTTVKKVEGDLIIAGATANIQNLLNITQLVRVFQVFDTIEDALNSA